MAPKAQKIDKVTKVPEQAPVQPASPVAEPVEADQVDAPVEAVRDSPADIAADRRESFMGRDGFWKRSKKQWEGDLDPDQAKGPTQHVATQGNLGWSAD
jgi:hypothetical protein